MNRKENSKRETVFVVLFNLLLILILLIAIETIAYLNLKSNHEQVSFLFESVHGLDCSTDSFDGLTIDPLLGWQYKKTIIDKNSDDYQLRDELLFLNMDIELDCQDTVVILITGNESSDVTKHPQSWPVHLNQIIKDSGICASLVLAAVSGYNSSQELLKLLRDGLDLELDYHISFTGANDLHPYFASDFEKNYYQTAYQNMMNQNLFMPNTIKWIRIKLRPTQIAAGFTKDSGLSGAEMWIENMFLMKSMSEHKGYKFISIIEPQVTKLEASAPEFIKQLISSAEVNSYIYDLSNFQSVDRTGDKQANQQQVASWIYELLM